MEAHDELVHLKHDYQSLQSSCRAFLLDYVEKYLEVADDALSVDHPHVAREKIDVLRQNIQVFCDTKLS